MEPGLTETATNAARGILESDPVLGGICILLAVALVALLIFHFRETGRLNGELVSQERAFRDELMTVVATVNTSIASIQQAMNIITARDK